MMEDKLKKPIVIDAYCEQQILKTFLQVKNITIFYLIWCTFSFIRYSWKLIINIQKPHETWVNIFSLRIYPSIYLIQILASILHLYYWRLGYRMQKESIQISDGIMFADSYKTIRKANVISIISIAMTIITTLIAVYAESTN
jgi:hypothetical protein